MKAPRTLLLLMAISCLAGAATAQSGDYYGPQAIQQTNQGGPWLSPAQRGPVYSHDLATGAITVRLAPWGVIHSARGPAIPFALVFSSGLSLEIDGSYPYALGTWSSNANFGGPAWAETTPTLHRSTADLMNAQGDECEQAAPYIFSDFNGVAHDLGLSHIIYADYGSPCLTSTVSASQSLDGSALYAAFAPGTSTPAYVTDAGGTRYFFDWSTGSAVLTKIEDANGNYVTVTGATGAGPEVWIDAADKVVLKIYRDQNGLPYLIQTFNSANQAQPYQLTWATQSPSGMNLAYPNAQTCSCDMNTLAKLGGGYELASLQLPDGSAYALSYDPMSGAVSHIGYPTGGWVNFAYGDAHNIANCVYGKEGQPGFASIACDQIAATDEWRNDGANTSHWTYSYLGATQYNEASATTTTVTDPLGQKTVYSFASDEVFSSAGAPSYNMLETQHEAENSSGTALRTTTTRWAFVGGNHNLPPYIPLPAAVQTVFNDAPSLKSTEADYTYDSYGNRIEEDDYGFAGCAAPSPAPTTFYAGFGCGPGALLKKTVRTFLADTGPWIVDKPLSETISDGSSNPQAQTTWEYDAYSGGYHAALTASGAVNHDSAYNAGGGITQRGNNTGITHCVAFTGSSCTSSLTSNAEYDDAGNRIVVFDAGHHATQYSFADAWADATCAPAGQTASFLTKVTDALGHVTTGTYFSCSGTLAARTGPNGNTTSYAYSDPWNRVTQINFPDGGETKYAYTENTRDTKRLQDTSGNWMDTLETVDGLGRPTITAVETAANQWSRTDTCYNGAAEVSFTSYPYYSSSNGGAANCSAPGDSFTFDALGRQTQTTHSDGSAFLTTYAGTAAETQDEGNGATRVTRILQNNALGQLASVCEITSTADYPGNAPANCGLDLAGTGFLTNYTDDVLGNLTHVAQGAESRSFQYL